MSKRIVLFALMSIIMIAASVALFCSKKAPVSVEEKDFTGVISGYVFSRLANMPLKGVNVFINADSATPAISGADGSFEIGKVNAGLHRIHFSRMDYDDDSSVTVTLSIGEEKKLDDTVRLSYSYYILKGKVLSMSGNAVVGAGVVCANTANSSMTDDAGNFIIDRLPKTGDNIKLICAKTDCGFNVVSPIRGVANDTTLVPDIALNKTGGTVTGAVYDSAGNPVAGAVVQSVAGGLKDTTATDGSYRIENVPTDENDISIYVSVNGKSSAISGLSVSSGAVVSGMDLRLKQPAAAGSGITLTANDVIVKDTAKTVTVYAFATADTVTKIAGYEWFLTGSSTPDTITTGNALTFPISKLTGASSGSDVQVKVSVKNQLGQVSPQQNFYIKIRSVHPVLTAKVSAFADSAGKDSAVIQLNQLAYFTGKATASFGGIDTMAWDFGDGKKWAATDSFGDVRHEYDTSGRFTAIFRVRSADGTMVRDTVFVIVRIPSIPAPQYVSPGNNDTVKTTVDSVRLVWHVVSGTSIRYNVYLSSVNFPPGDDEKVVSLTADTSVTVTIVKGKLYNWKVETVSSSANQKGIPWNFIVISGTPPNHPPVFSVTTADTLNSATVGKLYKDTVSASDADGDTVRFSFMDSVAGMSVGAMRGIIQWTPAKADTGRHTVSVLAKDTKGGIDTLAWTIYVADSVPANRPPVFTSTPAMMRDSADAGKLYRDTVHATDPDGDTVHFSFVDSVAGMRLTDSIITWTPATADTGAHIIKVKASDSKGHQVFLSWTITVVPIPVITQQPDAQTVTAGKGITLQVVATGSNLTYQWQKNSQNITSAVNATYSVLSASSSNAGLYRCIVCNGSGCDTSHAVQVTVNQPAATIINVKYNATGANTGASWANADTNLQTAIDSAKPGSEIWVAAGTYKPAKQFGGTGERFRSFQMKDGVAIYGGFVGTETQRSQRNFKNNATILSGDIGVAGDSSDNCYHVIYNTEDLALTETSVLDGFTVTKGNADTNIVSMYSGGGMYCKLCSPVIRNCTFTANSNSGGFGAGIYLLNSSLLIDSCQFTANNSNAYGGGLSNDHSLPTISNCIFKNNIAGYGGAIYNSFSNCKISSCQILLNSASNGDGGGIHCDNSSIIINNSYFNLNSGLTGCGLSSNSSSLVISNCSFVSNNGGSGPAVYISYDQSDNFTNCLFANNFTTGQGGAIFCNTGTLGVYNSTFLSNTSNLTDGGGAIWYTGKLTTANSIFWNNIAGTSSQDFSGFDTTTIHAAYCITKQALPTGTGFHISGADPLCVPVADNGGPVPTSALNDGCPAIDSGVYLYMDGNDSLMYNLNGKTTYYNLQGQPFTPTGTVTRVNATDARGVARPQRNGIDIGAFEKE